MRTGWVAVLGVALCVLVAGCGLGSGGTHAPSTTATPTGSRTSATVAGGGSGEGATATTSSAGAPGAAGQTSNEVPTPAPAQNVVAGWTSPQQAVRRFAFNYINWNYRIVGLRMRALASMSVGQARSMLLTAARQVGRDYELRRGKIANSGVVEAVAPLAGHGDQWVAVTRERTTAANSNAYQGLAPAWHVAVATVTQVRGLWVLSAWQPES